MSKITLKANEKISQSIERLGHFDLAWAVEGISLRERNPLLIVIGNMLEKRNILPLNGARYELFDEKMRLNANTFSDP